MHRLSSVSYMEISPILIDLSGRFLPILAGQQAEIDLPLECLLPPNLEILKITPYTTDFPTLWKIVEQKTILFPLLRKIILSIHYRDQVMADELVKARLKEEIRYYYPHNRISAETLSQTFPMSTEKLELPDFDAYCQKNGVELVLSYEDSERMDVLGEAGPAVWGIPEQIS